MAFNRKFPGSDFVRSAGGVNGFEHVPDGFSDWVKDIEIVLPGLAQEIDEMLIGNEPFLAIEVFAALGPEFSSWMQIVRNRNQFLFATMNELLSQGKIRQVQENFKRYTAESIGSVYH